MAPSEEAGPAATAAVTAEAVAEVTTTPGRILDPHLDSSILIAASDPHNVNHAAAVAYLNANRPVGLSASRQALREFLAQAPNASAFKDLQKAYRIKLARNVPQGEVNELASRLQQAFTD